MYRVHITGINSQMEKVYDRTEEFYTFASMRRCLGDKITNQLESDGKAGEYIKEEKVFYEYALIEN